MVEQVAVSAGDEQVRMSVVVKIGGRRSHGITRSGKPGLIGDVGESPPKAMTFTSLISAVPPESSIATFSSAVWAFCVNLTLFEFGGDAVVWMMLTRHAADCTALRALAVR